MKRFFYAAFAGVVVLFAACTKKEVEAPAENQQPEVVKSTPVYITAGIDPETTDGSTYVYPLTRVFMAGISFRF